MLSLLLLGPGCVVYDDPNGTKNEPHPADATPRVTLTSPATDSKRYGTTLEATFDVTNFTLDEHAMGGADEAGKGHVHVYLDGVLVGETGGSSWSIPDVPTGGHTVEVRLAENDHDEQWEGSWAYVETRDARLSILGPTEGTVLSASSAPLLLQIDGFDVSPAVAFGDPLFGAGRFLVEVDGYVTDLGVDPTTAQLTQLGEGVHDVAVELVHADGSPLDPPVRDSVSIEVLPASPFVAIDRAPYLAEHASATVPLAISTANAPLEYHLYVDGEYAVGANTPEVRLDHVPAGYHFVELRLTNGGSETMIRDHLHLFVAPGRPDVAITHPGEGWGVAPDFELAVAPENFTLDGGAMGGEAVPGVGHWSVAVDGVTVAESASSNVALSGLAAGARRIRVQLENNDHTPLDPPVFTEINVEVE